MASPRSASTTPRAPHRDVWRERSSRALHPSGRAGDETLVATIAAGLAAVAVPWELTGVPQPDERSYVLLLSTELYDAWLIHWPPGTGVEAHDHGGSSGALAVVSGVLHETRPGPEGGGANIVAGDVVTFDAEHVHAVANRGGDGATSVHVYSPPLRSMGFYDVFGDGPPVLAHVAPVQDVSGGV